MAKKKKMSRSENMSRIRSKDTSIEILLRKELWKRGLRYRKNDGSVFGKPDIVFKVYKIAIFCDSEFWHGKKYLEGKMPKTNKEYWKEKFKRNIERDKMVNKTLKDLNWIVFRFWDSEIKNDIALCADIIEKAIVAKKEYVQNSVRNSE